MWTAPGQRFEDAVLRAADRATGSADEIRALDVLDAINVPSAIVAAVLVLLAGLLRHKLFLGFVAAGMIAASITTTVIFQHFLERPILLAHGDRRQDQSFPSGHTAVALSLMCAIVLVAPYRWRGPVLVLGSLWAASVGEATVTTGWHRPSDTLGAALIVVAWACGAAAVLARSGRVRPAASRVQGWIATAYAILAVLAFALTTSVVALVLTGHLRESAMLLAGRSLALCGSAAVAAALLGLLRHLDLQRTLEGTPDV